MPNKNLRRHRKKHFAKDDQRSRTQRDRDRILYSSAFRRLSGVTQVVAPDEGHIFHNRLTHSLEVAQIGRRLAENLCKKHRRLANWYEIDVDAVEAACLAHDLGHPPFGHVAEKALDQIITHVHHELDGYEGNAQSFRIVTKLSVHDEYLGLNLTRAVLNAILKYPCFREVRAKKWGAYRTEREDFEWARDGYDYDKSRPCIEAAIMTWADDIAYAVHDAEDFYRAGKIPLEKLASTDDGETRRFLDGVFRRWQDENSPHDDATKERMRDAFDRVREKLPMKESYSGTRLQRLYLRTFTSYLIREYVRNTRLTANPDEPLEFADPTFPDEIKMLKELTWHYVVKDPSLAAQQHGHRMVISKLFDVYSDAIFNNDWSILPPRFKEEMEVLYEQYGVGIGHELRVRTTADIIASFTDSEALRTYQRLIGVLPGSVLDPIVR